MKRTHKSFLAATIFSAVLAVSANAANVSFTNCADALNQMGLFNGTDKGYELDREPTRGEAAAMLVRLLGKESEAIEKNYKSPFTDVPNWAQPYVGWLYENGLTKGTSDTQYSANSNCTAQMYTTFLMRTLGYKDYGDSTDFTYDDVISFALEKGVIDIANYDANKFLRDNVVAMSYTALATPPKEGGHDNLLDKLVSEGAIDESKAKSTQDIFDLYREYEKITSKFSKETKVDMNVNMNSNIYVDAADAMAVSVNANVKQDINLENFDKSKMLMNGTTQVTMKKGFLGSPEEVNEKVEMTSYFGDGYYYLSQNNEKIKMPMSYQDALEGIDIDYIMETSQEPISTIKSINKTSDGKYNISYSGDALTSITNNVMGSIVGDDLDIDEIKISKIDITTQVQDGNIKSMDIDMKMTFDMDTRLDTESNIKVEILNVGDGVVITVPTDLDSYKELEA